MGNWTRKNLKTQFDRAVNFGWIPHFTAAARKYNFPVELLIAIGSRETNLDPKWLTKAGDNGHGFGLMQADVRSFPEWIATGKWRDAKEGILMGALVLDQKRSRIQKTKHGSAIKVKSSKTGKYSSAIAVTVPAPMVIRTATSAYNCGDWAHYNFSKGQDVDKFSTGKDYSRDVFERMQIFAEFLKSYQPAKQLVDAGDVGAAIEPIEEPADQTDQNISQTETTIKTENTDVKTTTDGTTPAGVDESFKAYIPNIDTAKKYMKTGIYASTTAAISSFWLGLPVYIQIGLVAIVAILIIGSVYMLIKYHKEIFAYVTAMNTLRATRGVGNPILMAKLEK